MGSISNASEITVLELLALNMDGLKMTVIHQTQTGTLCLFLKEIKMLGNASLDVVTLIEHSPYCVDKILDYLRLNFLHSQELAGKPASHTVCD